MAEEFDWFIFLAMRMTNTVSETMIMTQIMKRNPIMEIPMMSGDEYSKYRHLYNQARRKLMQMTRMFKLKENTNIFPRGILR